MSAIERDDEREEINLRLAILEPSPFPSRRVALVKHHARLFSRFALVGATGVGVNLLVLGSLVTYVHVNYLLAEMFAAGVAAWSNYSLNVKLGVIQKRESL